MCTKRRIDLVVCLLGVGTAVAVGWRYYRDWLNNRNMDIGPKWEIIKSELTPERFLRTTNKGDNQIYIVTWQDSPNTLREIGRLREIAFRASGGGTGKSLDLDEFDTSDTPYKQLIVWDPTEEKILGGYRYILGTDWQIGPDGQPALATSHMFHFSEQFMKQYAPWTVELGRRSRRVRRSLGNILPRS